MDPLDYYEKGSSKEYETLLSMVATWFMGLWAVWTLPHIGAQCYSQKYTSSYVLKTYWFCDLRLVLKILSSKAIFEITIPLLGSFKKIFLINWRLCQRLFGNLSFSSFQLWKHFKFFWDYFVPIYFFEGILHFTLNWTRA